MSKTSKKFVTKHQTQEIVLPADNEFIGKILASRGNNLHEVETNDGEHFLVSMPTRFRKALWVRRGTFVILHPIEEGDKVRAEIVHVLDAENIEFLMSKCLWPDRFIADAEALTKRRPKATTEDVDDSEFFPPITSDSESENNSCSDEDSQSADGESEEEKRRKN